MHLSINRPTNKLSIFPFKSLPFPCFYLNNSMNSPVLKFKRLCKTPQVSSTSDQLVNTSDRVYLLNLSSQSHLFPMPNALVYFQPYFLNTQNFPTRPQASSLACCSSLLSSSSPIHHPQAARRIFQRANPFMSLLLLNFGSSHNDRVG